MAQGLRFDRVVHDFDRKWLDLWQETLTIRVMVRVAVCLVIWSDFGREGAASTLGRREDGAGGILKAKIGEEDQSTFVSSLSASRDNLSKQ